VGNVLRRAGRCAGPDNNNNNNNNNNNQKKIIIIIIIIIFDVWKGEMSVRGDVRRGKCPFPEHGSTGNYSAIRRMKLQYAGR